MSKVIEAHNITVGYGVVPVIHELSLNVAPGEVVALLGANGAGKTTTLLAMAGELPLSSGEVWLHGSATKSPLHRRAREGLGYIPEERSVFSGLSTRDNLRAGSADVDEALTLFPELGARLDVRGGMLSGGEQQMLTLARALGRHPKVLLADELSLGLAPLIVTRLFLALRAAADQGTGVLLVEQHVSKALKYADRVYVMRRGRIVLEGSAADVKGRISDIEDQYLSATAGPADAL